MCQLDVTVTKIVGAMPTPNGTPRTRAMKIKGNTYRRNSRVSLWAVVAWTSTRLRAAPLRSLRAS